MTPKNTLSFHDIEQYLRGLLGTDLHAKRILSLANATLGVIRAGCLAVHAIGQGLAVARGLNSKHAVKQVDRLLSNDGIDLDAILVHWVNHVVAARNDIKVAMDWTDFAADKQATIMLSLMTGHGRTTPLVWLTVDSTTLKNHRNEYEYRVLVRLAEMLPAGTKVCIVADRGFGDRKLYRLLSEELHFDYVIRFRGNIKVMAEGGEERTALGWVGANGRPTLLRGATVTAEHYAVGAILCVRDPDMKGAWCLATSYKNATVGILKGLYGQRWGIECGFRDTKDPRYGMGMGEIGIASPVRRDRLWLLNALAILLLTVLGAAGEALGYDRMLRSNTAKRRTHSLFRQGSMLYELIPNMPEARLLPLIEKFAAMLHEVPVFKETFGIV